MVITIFFEIAVNSVKKSNKEYIDKVDECYRLIANIKDKRWRSDALCLYNDTKANLEKMVEGNYPIPISDVNRQEDELLQTAKKTIYCVYYADGLTKLKLRLQCKNPHVLNTLIQSNKNISNPNVEKKRVIVLNEIDFCIEENRKLLREVDEFNTKPRVDGGLGFNMRYVLLNHLNEQQIPRVHNIILVDGREATTVCDKTVYPENYPDNNVQLVRDMISNRIINKVEINNLKINFQKIWNSSMGIDDFLSAYD